ncbi:MAG: hypothetical protein QXH24_07630 [Candidatus Bathyarchaeia archaeon]
MEKIKMRFKESPSTAYLAMIGALLILINGLWIALKGSAIVIRSSPNLYLNETQSTLWWRISLGVPDYVEGLRVIVWLPFAGLLLFAAVSLLIKPRASPILNSLIILCSVMTIPIGGGFIAGSILGIIGGLAGLEWSKPISETFIGRLIRSLRLDSTLFKNVSEGGKYLKQASWVLILVNLSSGLGYGIYSYNISIMNNSIEAKNAILINGKILFDISVFYYPVTYVGLAFIKWFILTMLIYAFGVKLKGSKTEFSGIAAAIAFAYAPAMVQAFLPLVFSTQPTQWAMSIFWVTNIWIMFALLIAIKESLEISKIESLGLLMICGGLYWIVTYKGIVPYFQVPGVWFVIEPSSFILLLFGIGVILSTLTGIFSRH